jgi:hypothetical protein
MVRLLETDPNCRVVLVEKTDRLYRNRTDSLTFEELIENRNVEVHLVKEGRIIGKNSRSQDKFMHDIHVAVANKYWMGHAGKDMSDLYDKCAGSTPSFLVRDTRRKIFVNSAAKVPHRPAHSP